MLHVRITDQEQRINSQVENKFTVEVENKLS